MTRTKVLVNKQVYVGLSVLDTRKTTMCEFCYNNINQNMEIKQNYATWKQRAL